MNKTNWISSPSIDLLIGCGLWSLPLMLFTYWASAQSVSIVAFAFYLLAMFCNNPHYMATIVRAYGSKTSFNQYRFFTIYLTVILALTLLVLHWSPTLLPWVFTIYIFWSPWHYTGQNFGIALMMSKRNGTTIEGIERDLIYSAFVASFLFWIVSLNTGSSLDAKLLTLNIPPSIGLPIQIALASVFIVCSVLGIYRIYKKSSGGVGFIVILLATQCLWFVLPTALTYMVEALNITSNYYNAGILAFMHCAQYLWITHYFAKKESKAKQAKWDSKRYYLTLIIGGIALFVPGPWVASWVFHFDLLESLFIFMALVNIHHFILDGAIWKLRDSAVARFLLGQNNLVAQDSEQATPSRSPHRIAKGIGLGLFSVTILAVGLIDQRQYFLTLKNTDESKLEQAALTNAHDSRIYFRRAKLLIEANKDTEAMAQLQKAVSLNPRNLPAQLAIGELLMSGYNPDAALAHFDQLATLFRPMVPILNNGGALANQTGNYPKALAYYEESLRLTPNNKGTLLSYAEASQLNGLYEQAIESYEHYLADVSDLSDKKRLIIQLKLGYAYLDANKAPIALALFDETAQLAHETYSESVKFEAMNNMAKALDMLSREDEASNVREAIDRLLKQNRTHTSVR